MVCFEHYCFFQLKNKSFKKVSKNVSFTTKELIKKNELKKKNIENI